MKNTGIIIVGAAIAALLLFRKGEGEGGSGGSLSIPEVPLDVLGAGMGPVTGVPKSKKAIATNTPSKYSRVIGGSTSWLSELAAIAKAGFSTEGISGSYDPATDTIFMQSDRWGVGPGQKPPTLAQAITTDGINWTAVSSAKKASSGGSSGGSSKISNVGSGMGAGYSSSESGVPGGWGG